MANNLEQALHPPLSAIASPFLWPATLPVSCILKAKRIPIARMAVGQ